METMDPRDMTPRQIIEVLGIAGRVSVVVFFDGGGDISCDGVGDNVAWKDPADFARLVEERNQAQLANLAPMLAEDIAEARARMVDGKMFYSFNYGGQSEVSSDLGLLMRIGHLVARGVPLPGDKAKPQEDPPLTVAEVAEYGKWSRKPTLVGICGTIFGNGIKMTIPELTAIVRGGGK